VFSAFLGDLLRFGAIMGNLGGFWLNCNDLCNFVHILAILGTFWQFWAHFGRFGALCGDFG
jgi:hypothetical protein